MMLSMQNITYIAFVLFSTEYMQKMIITLVLFLIYMATHFFLIGVVLIQ